MADITETTALVVDGSGVLKGAQQVEQGAAKIDKAGKAVETATQRVNDTLRGQERFLDSLQRKYDPAAAAAARFAKEEARLQGIVAAGGPNMARASQALDMLRAAQANAGAAAGRFGGALGGARGMAQQFGFQIADVATQISMGQNALNAFAVQGGQLLGAFGPWGAALGAVVTVLGAVGGAFLGASAGADKAAKSTDTYKEALEGVLPIIDRYNEAVDRAAGRPDSWRSERKAIADLRDEIARLEAERRKLNQPGFWGRDTKAIGDIDVKLGVARANLDTAMKTPAETAAINTAEAIKKLTAARADEAAMLRLAESEREKQQAALEAERKVREELKQTGASPEVIAQQVELARAHAITAVAAKQNAEAQKKASQDSKQAMQDLQADLKRYDAVLQDLRQSSLKAQDERAAFIQGAVGRMPDRFRSDPARVEKVEAQAAATYDLAEATKEQNKVREEGVRVTERLRTAEEQYAAEVQHLSDLLNANVITTETFTRGQEAAWKKMEDAGKKANKELIDAVEGFGRSSSRAFADMLVNGEGSFKQLGQSFITEVIEKIAYANLFGPLFKGLSSMAGSGGVGGFVGSLFSGVWHEGGIAGTPGPGRYVHPAAFDAAPRYHSGGIAGFAPNEVPAVLERGEEVLTREDPRHRLNGGGSVTRIFSPTVQVNVTGGGGDQQQNDDLARRVVKQAEAMLRGIATDEMRRQSRPGGMFNPGV